MRLKRTIVAAVLLFSAVFITAMPIANASQAQRCNGLTMFGTAGCRGYFTNKMFYNATTGITGTNILYNPADPNGWAIPASVNTAAEFIQYIKDRLGTGTTYNFNRAGAAFLIDTMLGADGGGDFGSATNGIAYAQANFDDWAELVNSYATAGRIHWNDYEVLGEGDVNSMHMCNPGTSGSRCTLANVRAGTYDAKDIAFFRKSADDGAEVSHEIVFLNTDGSKYRLRRECGNIVGPSKPLTPLPQPYNLTPSIGTTITQGGVPISGNVGQVGDTVTFRYTVRNTGSGDSPAIVCTIYGATYTGAHDIPTPPEKVNNGGYVQPARNCAKFNGNSTTTAATETITLTTANRTICRTFYIQPYKSGSAAEKGTEVCITVAARPYVKVFGGDVAVGAGIRNNATNTCSTSASGITAWNREAAGAFGGAGVQFAARALDAIYDFASAQRVAAPAATASSDLTFANTAIASPIFGGSFGTLPCMTDYYDGMPASANTVAGPTVITSNLPNGASKVTGNITLSGQVNPGQRSVLYVDGDVYIDNMINYPGTWDYKSVPLFQLVVRGNIYIKNTVTQVDGTYIAQPNATSGSPGAIYTCATSFAPLALSGSMYNACNAKLTINGQFSAAQVYLLRTRGTITDSSAGGVESVAGTGAAEVFNYTPANWLTQPPAGSNDNQAGIGDYDAVSSLPPVL